MTYKFSRGARRSFGRLGMLLLLGASALLAACGGGGGGGSGTTTPPPTVTLSSIAVTSTEGSSPYTVPTGLQLQFKATGTYSDNSTKDLTSSVTWSSSDGFATISNASGSIGLATGVSPGSATISATMSGITGTAPLTVTAATLVSIGVTPPTPSVVVGLSQQFTATAVFSDTSTQNISAYVTWSSSNPGVASISNTTGTNGVASPLSPGSTTITAALNGVSGTATLTVTSATLASIAVTPVGQTIAVGSTLPFIATGTYTDGSLQNLTATVAWSSATPSVASISNTAGSAGLATALSPGQTTITATLGGVAGSTTLNVSAATLVSIAVTPLNLTIAKGTSQQYSATGNFSDGSVQNLTSSVTWSVPATGVASISNAQGTQGLATSIGPGTVTVTATKNGISGTATLTVSAATLTSIAVTPSNPTLAKGSTEQFTATGTYSDGSTQNLTTAVTWTSSVVATASISNASGSNGLATTTGTGSTTITAALNHISGSTSLTVTAATLSSISVTPPAPTIAKGTTEQFTATGVYSDGSTQNLTSRVNWASSASSVATISNGSGSNGLATSVGTGQSTISASLGSVSGSTTLTVTAATLITIAVTPADPTIANGTAQQFTATGTYSDGSQQNITASAIWHSSAAGVATISNAAGSVGLATSVGTGSTTISAALSGVTGSTTLTVSAATLVSIAVTPSNPTIANGTSLQFAATGTYSDGTTQVLTSVVTWSSGTTSVATISNATGSAGLATPVAAGHTTIGASLKGIEASTTLTVTAATLVSIRVTPANATVVVGSTQKFFATGTYSDGSKQDVTSAATWSSSAPGVATISNAAGSISEASAVAAGSTTITATLKTITGSTTLNVNAPALTSIAVTPADPSITAGKTEQFVATGTYANGTTQNLTTSVTWSSATASVATISNASGGNGLATAVAAGSSVITAALGSISGSTTLTVTTPALTAISVTPTNPTVLAGATQQFVATGTFADGSTQTLTTSATWSSSAANVATISNAANSNGLATAVAAGSTTISAAVGAVTGSTTLTVSGGAPTLSSIAVTPAAPSIGVGSTKQFVATGTYSDGSTQVLTNTVTWASATPSVATISNATGTNGLATAVAVGTSHITATSGGVSGATTLTVTTAATLSSITVTPLVGRLGIGTSQQYVATGTYSDGSKQLLTTTVNWHSSSASVATISNTAGANGLATTVAAGTTSISAASGTVTSPAVPLTVTSGAQYAYVANSGDGTVSQFSIGAGAPGSQTGGLLTPAGTPTVTASATGEGTVYVAVDPSGRYLYAINEVDNAVWQYTIGAAGTANAGLLSAMSPSNVVIPGAPGPVAISVDPSGRYVYVANSSANTVAQFTIGSNGALSPMSPVSVATDAAPQSLTVDPTGKYLYVANQGTGQGGTVTEYSIGTTGGLTALATPSVAAGASPQSLAVDPTGRYLYVANYDSTGDLYQFTIGPNGVLSPLSPISVTADQYSYCIAIDPAGSYVYVANTFGDISQFSFGSNGTLTAFSPEDVSIGNTLYGIAVDRTGQYAYVVDNGAGNLSEYSLGTGGVLTPLSQATVTTGSGSGSLPYSVVTTF